MKRTVWHHKEVFQSPPTGRLPFAFPVGSLGRVYLALFAHIIAGHGANGATHSLPPKDARWIR